MGAADSAARRHSRSLRHPGHRLHRVSRAGAAGGRGSGHLSADHGHADRAEVEGGARVVFLRRVVRLRHLRGRHRHLLGALARARIPQCRLLPAAIRRDADDGPGRHRRRLGLPIRRRCQEQVAGRVALAAGLGDPLRAGQGRRRGRGRQHRRLRQAVQRRHRSRPHALAWHSALQSARGHPPVQHGRGRPHGGACGARVHGARPRLHQERRRSGTHRRQGGRRDAGPPQGHCEGGARPG